MDEDALIVLDLIDLDMKEHNKLNLHCIAGRRGLDRNVTVPETNRPGLALSGFYDSFAWERIQILGHGEVAYLQNLEKDGNFDAVRKMFSYKIPCCVFTASLTPPQFVIDEAENSQCAVLQTDVDTSDFVIRLSRILSNIFSPKIHIHGVLMEVYGLGVLITGESAVGKSEVALELIKYGHRLVADDVVEIHCINGNILLGTGANKIIAHHMEIRGIGIVNITHLYGVGAIRTQKQVQLVVKMEEWDANKNYDRLGHDEITEDILGVNVPALEIPVKPGRNVPTIIETAVMNERLKSMGYNAAQEFNRNVLRWLESKSGRSVYFGRNDTI
jgi:HPr kinase/phosphorylase